MPKSKTGDTERLIKEMRKDIEEASNPAKRMAARREREKAEFVQEAKKAGFTELQALFLYERVSLPGHEHFTLARIGGGD